MREKSRGQLAFANFEADQAVGKSVQAVGGTDQLVAFQGQVRTLVRDIWKAKTAQHFSIHADVTVRQAERFLSGEQGISLAIFLRLVRGLHGERFLHLMMGASRPAWWVEMIQERQITAVKRRRRELEKELRELEAER